MSTHFRNQIVVALAVFFMHAPSAPAFVYWSNASGTAAGFDWSGGGSDNGLYGDPLLLNGNTFVFSPADFRADSINGEQAATADRLQVDLTAHSGLVFAGIRFTESGDIGILGQGSASVNGTLLADDLDQPRSLSQDWQGGVGGGGGSGGSGGSGWSYGGWGGGATIPIEPSEAWRHIRVEVHNNLLAVSTAGNQIYIQKAPSDSSMTLAILLPEPGMLAMLAFGAIGLPLARKR